MRKIIVVTVLTFMILISGCSTIEKNSQNEEKEGETSDQVEIIEIPSYPIELNQDEINQWIKDHEGRYQSGDNSNFGGNDFDLIEINIVPISDEWKYNIYQITCCINDGVVYLIEGITQEDETTYSLHLNRTNIEGVTGFQDFTMFPTNTYLIRDEDLNDGKIELQFVGVNTSTLDSFTGEIENGNYFRNYPSLYKDNGEWYVFMKQTN